MAITNVKTRKSGHSIVFTGNYTHTLGAAAETLTVPAGRVVACQVNPQGTINSQNGGGGGSTNYTTSTSGYVQTITFGDTAAVSAGTVRVEVELA